MSLQGLSAAVRLSALTRTQKNSHKVYFAIFHHIREIATGNILVPILYKSEQDLRVCVFSSTCDAEGLLSRPLFVRLSRPLSEEKRPLLRCL